MSQEDAELDNLTLLFGDLEVTVRRRSRAESTGTDEGFELVGQTGPALSSPASSSSASEAAVLAAFSAEALGALDLPQLRALARRLTGAGGEWSGTARVARAYRAGLGAKAHLNGGHKISSPTLPGLRNSFYIVLRGPSHPEGIWTKSYQTYAAAVRPVGGPRGSFDSASASHSSRHSQKRKHICWEPGGDGLLIRFEAANRPPWGGRAGTYGSDRYATAFLLRVRANGFMVVLPDLPAVRDYVEGLLNEDGDRVALTMREQVQVETVRGRHLGPGAALLADFPWSSCGYFVRSLRGLPDRASRVLSVSVGAVPGRPMSQDALDTAARWVERLDPDTAQEYWESAQEVDLEADVDGEPMDELAEEEPAQPAPNRALGSSPAAARASQAPRTGAQPGGNLFNGGRAMTDAAMARLQRLAGSAPARVGLVERQQTAAAAPEEDLALEAEFGALPPADVQDPAEELQATTMQSMLLAQMRQNAILLEKLVHKGGALEDVLGGGSGSGGDSSGAGIKGHLAREAFLKQVSDLKSVANKVQNSALLELGMTEPEPGLMREFVEKRIPLADQKVLQHVAAIASHGWELGYRSKNEELMGFTSRLLMFVEQSAFGWGKNPARDLDYAETRIAQLGNNRQPPPQKPQPPEVPSEDAEATGESRDNRFSPSGLQPDGVAVVRICGQSRHPGGDGRLARAAFAASADVSCDSGIGFPTTAAQQQVLDRLESHSWASQLHASFLPYEQHKAPKPDREFVSSPADGACAPKQFLNFRAGGPLPVVADRIKWKYGPSFDPTPYLEPVVQRAFADPSLLRRPKHEWPALAPARLHCSKSELLKLAEKWDGFGAVRVMPACEVDWEEAVGYSKSLTPGSLLTLLHLEPGIGFRYCADDLSDYYYSFKISALRAVKNSIRCRFEPEEISHLRAAQGSVLSGPQVLSLNTMAMGDSLAVEVGQGAHYQVLRQHVGSLIPEETLLYRRAVPKTDTIELLAIDDHVSLQKLPLADMAKEPTPVFAVVDSLFKEGLGRARNIVFRISNQSRNELMMLAALASTLVTDLRATVDDRVYCVDASPQGGAVCAARVGSKAASEIWRHGELRGYHTRLESEVSAVLTEKGIPHEGSDLFGADQRLPEDLLQQPSLDPLVPRPLREGLLFDLVVVQSHKSSWGSAFSHFGVRVLFSEDLGCADDGSPCGLSASLARELCTLALRGVVREWHSSCFLGTFGTLLRPRAQTPPAPEWPAARRLCFIMTVALRCNQWINVEQPASSSLFRLACFRNLAVLGCVLTSVCWCSFGAPFSSPKRWLHNKPWLCSLQSRCSCEYSGRHWPTSGSFTESSLVEFAARCKPSLAQVYESAPSVGQAFVDFAFMMPLGLSARLRSGTLSAYRGHLPRVPLSMRQETARKLEVQSCTELLSCTGGVTPYPPRSWHEDPEWIGELCKSLPFSELFRYRFVKPGHINVNEARVFKSWLKSVARSSQGIRATAILDSRVTIGAAAKGRSSSGAISRVLQGSLGYVLGSGIYYSLLHCYSQDNVADPPSRDRDVEPPTRAVPRWLEKLLSGDSSAFESVVASSRVPKNAARWLRFVLLLAGDIERNPGPRAAPVPPTPRGPLDLSAGFASSTSHKMKKSFNLFLLWIAEHVFVEPDTIFTTAEATATALRGFGLHLYENGWPRYIFVFAITAVADRYPAFRNFLTPAWQIDKKWQRAEPGSCRAVLPVAAIRAAVSLGLLWGWFRWTALLIIGFLAMLHPGELLALTRRDLVFPVDTLYHTASLFVHLRNPKTSRFARRQHGRIDDPSAIRFIYSLAHSLRMEDRLYPASLHSFRRQWNAVMEHLGLPNRAIDRGATPGVLRGSGATHFYLCTENIPLLAWRGRWSRTKTLEYYLQEVAAQVLLSEISPASRSRIRELDQAADDLLDFFSGAPQ
ncbi:unnamed protein product [Symbiodinium sp. CCMP2592]|nr:unnamed protein product [Symbiodinium sp. CCMP2592]